MPKFQRLLFDANVIIFAHELGVWGQLIKSCKVTVTKTIVEEEALYWKDEEGNHHQIDLNEYVEKGEITCVHVPLTQLDSFCQKFDPTYLDRLDPGEADSLAFLYHSQEKWYICSSDGIVFKILGCLGKADQGLSLEEVLHKIGLGRQFDSKHKHYNKEFRLNLTKKGQQNGITGMGLK